MCHLQWGLAHTLKSFLYRSLQTWLLVILKKVTDSKGENFDGHPTFEANCSPSEPHILTQGDFNGLVRNLVWKVSWTLKSQTKSVECSPQTDWNIFLSQSPKWFKRIFPSRKRSGILINVVGHQHDPTEWRLFIDSSKVSLKAVLLHKGNEFPFVPLALAANVRLWKYETNFGKYEVWKIQLEHLWRSKGHCCLALLAAWLHKGWLLAVLVGQKT